MGASDRFGRRAPLRAGLVLYVAAAIGATLVPSFGWVVALRFLVFVLSTGVLAAMVIRELMKLF